MLFIVFYFYIFIMIWKLYNYETRDSAIAYSAKHWFVCNFQPLPADAPRPLQVISQLSQNHIC